MFKLLRVRREYVSDAEFRKYERAVEAKQADAIPGLITCAIRTNTPIHRHLPFIYENLTQDAIRTLEGSELMDLRLYRVHSVHEAAAIIERTARVIPSLEIIALNHQITGFAGKDDSDILMKECVISLDSDYLIRANPIAKLANGQRIQGTVDEMAALMQIYAGLAERQMRKHAAARSISSIKKQDELCTHNISKFLKLSSDTRIEIAFPYTSRHHACEQPIVISSIDEQIRCEARRLDAEQTTIRGLEGVTMPLATPKTEHLLGNPNVFEFP